MAQEIESKPLPANTKLRAALNKLPAPWVHGIAWAIGEPASGLIKQVVQAVADHLTRPATLQTIWAKLPEPSRRMAAFLVVDEGGHAPIGKLTRRFGRDEDGSWFWDQGNTPVTPLGLLRLHGIAFVGKANVGGRNTTIATVPVELRAEMARLAAAPDAFAGAPPMPEPPADDAVPAGAIRMAKHLYAEISDEPVADRGEMSLGEFLAKVPIAHDTEPRYRQVLDQVRSAPEAVPPAALRELLGRMIREGGASSRLAAYRLALTVFGEEMAKPALQDPVIVVRRWAEKTLVHTQGRLF